MTRILLAACLVLAACSSPPPCRDGGKFTPIRNAPEIACGGGCVLDTRSSSAPIPSGGATGLATPTAWRLLTVTYDADVRVSNPMPREACDFARARVLGEPATAEEKQAHTDMLKAQHDRIEHDKAEAVQQTNAPRCYDSKTAEWCTYDNIKRMLGHGNEATVLHRNGIGIGGGTEFTVEDGKVTGYGGGGLYAPTVTGPRDVKVAECFQ